MSCIGKPGFAGFVVATVLLFAVLTVDAVASGDEESAEGAAPAADAAMAMDFALPPGHYNLDTYEQAAGAKIASFQQSPMLQGRGLPPVEDRLPDNPLVMVPWEELGTFGGTMRIQNFTAEMRRMGSAPFYETRPGPGVGREGKRLQAELEPGVMEWWEVSARRQVGHHPHPQGAQVVGRQPGHYRRHRVLLERCPQQRGSDAGAAAGVPGACAGLPQPHR